MPPRPIPLSEVTLEQATNGDENAIAEIWRTWNPPLLRLLRGRKVAEPDDLAQTIWMEIARKLGEFSGGPEEFRRWLFTVAHRRVIDSARRSTRQLSTAPLLDHDGPAADPTDTDIDWAIDLLQRLPDSQATAVALRILADMDVVDVAEVMGKSPGAVRVLTHRGLNRLGEIMEPQEKSEERVTKDGSPSLTLLT